MAPSTATLRVLLVVAIVSGGAAGAAAAEETGPSLPPLVDPGPSPISADLGAVATDADAVDPAAQDYAAARLARTGADAALVTAVQRAGEQRAAAEEARLEQALRAASQAALEARTADQIGALQAWAVARYVGAQDTDEVLGVLDPRIGLRPIEARVVSDTVVETLSADLARLEARRADASVRLELAQARLDTIRARSSGLDESTQDAAARRHALTATVGEHRAALDDARALATVEGADFPLVALDAYWKAAGAARREDRCAVEWWAIAAVARVEGRHGSYGGATLEASGATSPPIIGIPLDGTNGTRIIADTDQGRLDGDPAFDRAVGPMQFIPSTWARAGLDGNDDGDIDPHNLYDATRSAAGYLCRASVDLVSDEGLRRGLFSYNQSVAYGDEVLGVARGYEAAVTIPEA